MPVGFDLNMNGRQTPRVIYEVLCKSHAATAKRVEVRKRGAKKP